MFIDSQLFVSISWGLAQAQVMVCSLVAMQSSPTWRTRHECIGATDTPRVRLELDTFHQSPTGSHRPNNRSACLRKDLRPFSPRGHSRHALQTGKVGRGMRGSTHSRPGLRVLRWRLLRMRGRRLRVGVLLLLAR